MFKFFVVLMAGLFLPTIAQSAPNLDCSSLLVPKGRPRVKLDVWRYYGRPHFDSVHHISLSMAENGQHYLRDLMGLASERGFYESLGQISERQFDESYLRIINPLRAEKESVGQGDDVFERLQYYSLKLMEKINYLKGPDRDVFVQNSRNLHPNQITLFEASETFLESQLIAKYGRVPEGARLDTQGNAWADYRDMFDDDLVSQFELDEGPPNALPSEKPKPDPVYEMKVGVSWLVAGQDIDRNYIIPSEDDSLEVKIDRSKYKLIWEVGRAGQSVGGAYEETLRAAAYQAYWELLANGGRIEDAYIFAHSLDAVHTRLFRSKFGMRDFSKYKNKPAERCMVAPLIELLRRYPPETYSAAVADIVGKSNGKISGLEAMQMIFRARTQSDVVLNAAGGGIHLRDFGAGVEVPYHENDLLNHTAEFADDSSFGNRISVQGSYGRDEKIRPLRNFLFGHRAIEISLVGQYSNSAKILLGQALAFLRQQKKLREGTNICVTTGAPSLVRELRQLEPFDRWYVSRGHYVANSMGTVFGGGFHTVARPMHLESLCFRAGDLKDIPLVEPPTKSSGEVKRWLGNPEFYAP